MKRLSVNAGRVLGGLLILLFITAIAFSNKILDKSSKYVTPKNEINYRQYMFIPYGKEEKALGHNGYQSTAYGPGSFAIANDGSVYVLDSFNRKIKRYTATSNYMYSIELPGKVGGVDFEIKDQTIYLLCSDNSIYAYNLSEKLWTRKGYSQLKHLCGMYTDNGEVSLLSWDGDGLKLSSDKGILLSENLKSSPVKAENLKSDLFYCCVLRTTGEETYVLEQETLNKNKLYSELRVVKYSGDEIKETALAAPLEYYIYSNPFKKLYLTPSGEIYQLMPTEKGVTIFHLPWFEGEKTRITAMWI